jgi:hypothetical protein
MTAPKGNFCFATDLALISEPATSGGGIIGIVSYNSRQDVIAPPRSSRAIKLFRGAVERIRKLVGGSEPLAYRQGIMINPLTARFAVPAALSPGISQRHSVDCKNKKRVQTKQTTH